MKYLILIIAFLPVCSIAQDITTKTDKDFSNMIDSYLSYTVPLISVEDLSEIKDNVILLDAREPEEYKVSHIPGAQNIGYDNPDKALIQSLDKSKTVVVYCSIGYRSEKIGEVLQEEGFKNVLNLYGSIFEWVNQGLSIEDMHDMETKSIHTYDKKWGKWMMNKNYKKVN